MKKDGSVFPLTIAHLFCVGAYQTTVPLAFFDLQLAVIPLIIFVLACLIAPFFPGLGFYLPVSSKGNLKKNAVALTFDDGPDPVLTPKLLKLLASHNVTATFFITGKNADMYPDIVKDIIAQGHLIGNHSWNHYPLLMLKSSKTLKREIETTQNIFKKLGFVSFAFRPPVGIVNPKLWRVLLKLGMHCVNFNNRAGDRGNRNIKDLSKKILRKLKQDDIVLLHDVCAGPDFSADKWLSEVDLIIEGIKGRGFDVLPLSEMIGKPVMKLTQSKSTMNPIRTFYNGLALDYDDEQSNTAVSIARKKESELFLSRFNELFTGTEKVLEIGSGTGVYTMQLAKHCKEVTAVDISEDMLEVLKLKCKKENVSNIKFIAGDVESMDIDDEFDVMCSFSSFEYISDISALINKLSVRLKPGGVLYIITGNRSLFKFFTQIGNALRQGIWLRARSKREIKRLLYSAGFESVNVSSHLFKSVVSDGMLLEVFAVAPQRYRTSLTEETPSVTA